MPPELAKLAREPGRPRRRWLPQPVQRDLAPAIFVERHPYLLSYTQSGDRSLTPRVQVAQYGDERIDHTLTRIRVTRATQFLDREIERLGHLPEHQAIP